MSLKDRLSEPGFIVSAVVHVGALAATLVAFSQTPKFDDIQETVPVDIVTDNQFNEIMRGEKTAKEVRPEALAKAEQVAPVTEVQPDPPTPDQSRDSQPPPPPPPPPPVKQVEPVKPPTDAPPPPVAVLPPPRPEPPQPDTAPPVPTPPVRDVDAEPVAPKPPKPLAKPVVKPVPTPPVQHQVVKVHDSHPPPKFKPVDKPKVDQVARLMGEQPPTDLTPAPRPPVTKTKPAPDPAPESKFDLTDITKLLLSSHEAPAQRPSTGHDISHLASLGSPTASAAKMSPSLWAGLDGLLEDQYRACWSYLGLTSGKKYIPQVRVVFAANGGLEGDPVLINPPSDPSLQSLADSALRAVRRCNPLKIPDQYAPFYDQWRGRVLRFDPEEMAG